MSICYDEQRNTLTLQTARSTYQMRKDEHGFLQHVYYGRTVTDGDMSYLHRRYDRGFSGNPYDCGEERNYSLDIEPLEYSCLDTGDYRVPALSVAGADGAYGADLRFDSFEIRKGKYSLPGLPAAFVSEMDDADTLVVTLKDPRLGLAVRLYYGVFRELDVITRAAEIVNEGKDAVFVEKAASLCLDFPFGRWDLIHFHGRHAMERQTERFSLKNCVQTISSGRGISSHQHNPFVILCEQQATEDSGDCFGCMLAYSGSYKIEAEQNQMGSVRLVSGISDEKFRWRLSPGESFFTPEALLCYSSQGLGELSRNYHEMIRRHICRGKHVFSHRPVVYNNWEATTADFDEEKLLSLAAEAAGLGCELFVLDDGWFHLRADDRAGLGDWFADRQKLPSGLKGLSEKIRGMGMQFGLWVEPECVNEDSDLYRAHPDWAFAAPDRPPVLARKQLVLDLTRADVREYLYDCLYRLLSGADISYIKWDMNRALSDVYSNKLPPDRQGEAGHRYMLGLYELLERITSAFPDVLFEGCSGGGGRFDAGMLYYTNQIWCSDNTDAILRLEIQKGTSYGYPVSSISCHVTQSPNQQSGRTVPLKTRGAVAMSGAFGYEMDLTALTEEERAEIRRQIALYKDREKLIHGGKLYRLSGRGERDTLSDTLARGGVYAWMFVSADRGEALVNVAAVSSQANGQLTWLRLKGLDENAQYRIEAEDGSTQLLSGAALMYAGYSFPMFFGDYPSACLRLTRIQ